MTAIENNPKPMPQRVDVNVAGLQSPVNSFQAQLQAHNQLLQGILKAIGITPNELNFVEVVPRGKSDPVLYSKYMAEVVKAHNSKALQDTLNYLNFIKKSNEKPYIQRVQEWQIVASENKSNSKNFNKDVKPQKIVFDLNELDKQTSTNIAMGPAKIASQDTKGQPQNIKQSKNSSGVGDQATMIRYSNDWIERTVLELADKLVDGKIV